MTLKDLKKEFEEKLKLKRTIEGIYRPYNITAKDAWEFAKYAREEGKKEGRKERDREIAKLIEDIVFNHVTPELEKKVPIKHLRNIVQALKSKQP